MCRHSSSITVLHVRKPSSKECPVATSHPAQRDRQSRRRHPWRRLCRRSRQSSTGGPTPTWHARPEQQSSCPTTPSRRQGTAQTEVPRMTDFISHMIKEHGAENVSVLGDSAGGGFALLAAQELARRGSPQPSRSRTAGALAGRINERSPQVHRSDDPLLDVGNLVKTADCGPAADTQDPLVSPLFGPLNDLPPIYVYSSSRDTLSHRHGSPARTECSPKTSQASPSAFGKAYSTIGSSTLHCPTHKPNAPICTTI